MYGKLFSLGIALFALSIASTSAVLASSTSPAQSMEEAKNDVLSEARIKFNDGQGMADFDYKSNDRSAIVRVYVKNTSNKQVNYKLISPSGWTWIRTTIDPGKAFHSEHAFGSRLEGNWSLKFDTDDGSPVSLEISVRVKP